MKILLINDYATPTGGAELLTLALRDGFRKRGYDARVFASSARASAGESFADFECFGTTSRFRTLLQAANPWAFRQLRRVLDDFQPDIVHVRMFLTQLSPLILPLLKDVPSLYHVVWYRPICPLGTKMLPDGSACQMPAGAVCYRNRCLPLRDYAPLMLQMKLWRRWRNAFNVIVANSEAVRRRLMAEGIGPAEVVWNGVPIPSPRPSLHATPIAAFAGRLVPEKGVDVLLRAFARVVMHIPEARLLLIGDGPEHDRLKELTTNLRLSSCVSLLGHVPHPDIERVCSGVWVHVVPSRWAEPFGRVAIEAMMRGTAVIASNSGGLTEIVEDGKTGLLVPAGDVQALAAALRHLLYNRQLAEQMGKAGRELALARFSEATWIDRFVALYQTLRQSESRTMAVGQMS
jgi:glycosyltransferase involved in cell wall biosynthesis